MTEFRILQKKQGRDWITTYTQDNIFEVYRSLSRDLIGKYIKKAGYIKSIKRSTRYDGTQNITVTYDNNTRSIYEIEN